MSNSFVYKTFVAVLPVFAAMLTACGGTQSAKEGPAEVVLHTMMGDICLELDARTPRHRDNFLRLVRENALDSLLFHRVIEGFMIQSGDPDSRRAPAGAMLGEGESGERVAPEIVYPALNHLRGALAAAREGDASNPDRLSSASQFYIVWGRQPDDEMLDRTQQGVSAATNGRIVIPDSLRTLYKQLGGAPWLDGQYTVFGRVLSGLEVVEAIQRVATDPHNRPLEDIRILSAEITRDSQTCKK